MGCHSHFLKEGFPVLRTPFRGLLLRALPAVSLLLLALTALPASGSQEDGGTYRGRFNLFQHDTTQQSIDLGDPGPSVGDQLVLGGDLSNHQGGTLVGRSAGQCTFSSEAEILCLAALSLEDGQITFQGIVDTFTFFTNHPVDFAITGGTGPYHKARGTVTVLILPGVPNGTDAVVTVDLR